MSIWPLLLSIVKGLKIGRATHSSMNIKIKL